MIVIVPFIRVGWIAQWYVYVPGALNTSACVCPVAIVSVAHVPSSREAVCPALSLFVQPIASPTLAVTGSGEKAKFLIDTATFGAAPAAPAAAGAQAAALLAPLDGAAWDAGAADAGAADAGAADAGAATVAGAAVAAVVATGLVVVPVPQAPRTTVMASATAKCSSRCIE